MDKNQFMHPDGSPKTAFDMFCDSCSLGTFGQWKMSPEQQAHVEKYWGDRRVPAVLKLLRQAA